MSVTFHILDSLAQDTKLEDKDSYTIHLFGSTPEGVPVQCTVQGFEPFFYVEIPSTRDAFSDFLDRIQGEMASIPQDSVRFDECSKAPMYGYSGGKKLSLLKISTKTRRVFYSMKKIFLDERSKPIFKLYHDLEPLRIFDANLDPMLRFFHLRNLQPCGWVKVLYNDIDNDSIIKCLQNNI